MGDSALPTMDAAQQAGVAVSAARQRAVRLLNGIASSAEAWHRKMSDAQRERTASGATAAELGRLTSFDWGYAWPVNYDDLREACRCLVAIGFGPAAERIFDTYGCEFSRWFGADAAVMRSDWTPEEREQFENKLGPVPAVPETPEDFRDLYIQRVLATAGVSELAKFIRKLLDDVQASGGGQSADASARPLAKSGRQSKGGRPTDTDPDADRQLRAAWEQFKQSGGGTYKQFAALKNAQVAADGKKRGQPAPKTITAADVKAAVDRDRKRPQLA